MVMIIVGLGKLSLFKNLSRYAILKSNLECARTILSLAKSAYYLFGKEEKTASRRVSPPPSIEEVTGLSSVEQNRLVAAAKVRDSLILSQTDPDVVTAFDMGGAALLYEIRFLSAAQRSAAAEFIVRSKFEAKGAQDLARAMKDFPRRLGDKGWEKFEYKLPGDCLSFMYYRQSREHRNPSEQRTAALEHALTAAETEKAKGVILEELEGKGGEGDGGKEGEVQGGVRVPVVRMKMGEVAEASSVVVLPVCRAEERGRKILEAPWGCKSQGEFGVVVAEKGWARWVVLPGWESVLGMSGGVVVAFPDARVLPWKVNMWYKEEAILVVADRGRKEVVEDEGFYMVAADADGSGGGYGLKVAIEGDGVGGEPRDSGVGGEATKRRD